MPSKLRSEAARRNGAKSHGPVTEAGKRASSLNAIKHGVHSSQIVLSMEDPEQYDRLLAAYLDKFQPVGPVEEALVMDIVNARWRLQRIQHLETAIVDLQIDAVLEDPGVSDDARADHVSARAYQILFDQSRAVSHLHRQEARLNRVFHRSLALLQELQAQRQPTQPEPATPPQIKKQQNEPETDNMNKIQQFIGKTITRNFHVLPAPSDAPHRPAPEAPPSGALRRDNPPSPDGNRGQ